MVLPVYDDNPTRRVAYVTWGLIAFNVIVFLFSPVRAPLIGNPSARLLCAQKAFYEHYAAIPSELVHMRPLDYTFAYGSGRSCHRVARTFDKHVLLSAFTYMFVHGGILHLLGNMLFLWIFGNNVEDRLGRCRFLVFYLTVGIVAAFSFALVNPSGQTPLVGASGSIAGVLGAYLVLYPKVRVTGLLLYLVPLRLPAWVVLGVWFGIQAFYTHGEGVTGGEVAYFVHVVGFVLGVAYAALVRRRFTGPTGTDPRTDPPPAAP